ncbi:MAG: hypothetical protein HYU75_07230, partial [Betaproteobacteria bacterium]|nr:hypothetical protein [Betaproteobacteria bacterium]
AVRLGFLMVQGLSQAGAERIAAARKERAFESAEDLARRAALNRHDLKRLAAAGALESLAGHRRLAYWDVAGIETGAHMLRDAPVAETRPELTAPTEGETLVADYASLGFSQPWSPITRASAFRSAAIRWRSCAGALRACAFRPRRKSAPCPMGRVRVPPASLPADSGRIPHRGWCS